MERIYMGHQLDGTEVVGSRSSRDTLLAVLCMTDSINNSGGLGGRRPADGASMVDSNFPHHLGRGGRAATPSFVQLQLRSLLHKAAQMQVIQMSPMRR